MKAWVATLALLWATLLAVLNVGCSAASPVQNPCEPFCARSFGQEHIQGLEVVGAGVPACECFHMEAGHGIGHEVIERPTASGQKENAR